MKYGVSPAARALFFVTLFAVSLIMQPIASAVGNDHVPGGSANPSQSLANTNSGSTPPAGPGQGSNPNPGSSGSSSSSSSSSSGSNGNTNQPVDLNLLYRVRYGAAWRGEVTDRFYIERNIALAAQQGIIGDDDPDGDGWAILGHTGPDYDGKKYAGLSFVKVKSQKFPAITLNWNNDAQCAQLMPTTLDVVQPGEDRLLKATVQRMCFAPSTDVSVVILPAPLEMPKQATDEPIQAIPVPDSSLAPQDLPMQIQSEPLQPQQTDGGHVLNLIGQVPVPGLVDSASTNVPNHIDGPVKPPTEPVQEIGNSIMVAISVTVAVILGIVVLVHTAGIMKAWR